MHASSEERLFPSWQTLCISQKGLRRSLENSQEGRLKTPVERKTPIEIQEGLFQTDLGAHSVGQEGFLRSEYVIKTTLMPFVP